MTLAPGRVTIGVPVYNGARHLRETLHSLLAQDYPDLRFIISDNASTDGTPALIEEFARADARIECVRNVENRGAVFNLNRLAELAQSEFFMWAGAHDLWAPDYVSRCVQCLREDSTLALAYSYTRFLDEHGETVAECAPDRLETRGQPALARYLATIWQLEVCNILHGVMRTAALRRTAPLLPVWGPDLIFLAELALQGGFAQIPAPLFTRRRPRAVAAPEENKRRIAETVDPASAARNGAKTFPQIYAELEQAHEAVLLRSALGSLQKLRARLATRVCFHQRWGVPYSHRRGLNQLLHQVLGAPGLTRLFR